jgi:hypothetical protein
VVAPQVFDAEKTITLVVGAIAAYLTFALGWVLFGIALLRTRVVPVAVPPGWSSAVCSGSRPDCRRSASRSAWPSPRWRRADPEATASAPEGVGRHRE